MRQGRTRKGNPAVGEADKPLRDFSLALLSSIDVDSRSPRDVKLSADVPKALVAHPLFHTPFELIADFGVRRPFVPRETPRAVLRFAADLPIRRIREFARDFIARAVGVYGTGTCRRILRGPPVLPYPSSILYGDDGYTTGNKACRIATRRYHATVAIDEHFTATTVVM